MTTRTASLSVKAGVVATALLGAALITADFADARGGRGGSFGSRGTKTFSAPAPTRTAPSPSPVQRSITQPRPGATAAAAQSSRGSMVRNLLLGGLIGAGLASLFGFGGGFAAVLGFILQMALIAGVVMLVVSFFRNRSGAGQPALAQAAAGASTGGGPDAQAYRTGLGAGSAAQVPDLNIGGDDYNAFERLLKEIQLAYANADVDALGERVTPEVLSEFARELDENKRRGLSNDLSEPKLLQGDLSEAWREAGGEYATVAMRYEIIDALVETKSGRVVQGSTTEPQQVTEVWTFRRPVGGNASQWELSAIQQA